MRDGGTTFYSFPTLQAILNVADFQAALESIGLIDKYKQYDLVTTNLEKLLGVDGYFGNDGELVIYQGGDAFNMSSKVVGVASPRKGAVELF